MAKDKLTYQEMIDLLKSKQHQAPISWDQIVSGLRLDQSIAELPTHKAPDNLWAGIEEGLDQPESSISPSRPAPKTSSGLYILLSAILFLISTLIVVNFLGNNNQESEYEYKSEIEMASLHENKVMLDDNIDEVLQYIENNSFMFSDEQLKEFNAQLSAINTALEKLMEMQTKYGMDESSSKMMAKMERDKADLLKSMIVNS